MEQVDSIGQKVSRGDVIVYISTNSLYYGFITNITSLGNASGIRIPTSDYYWDPSRKKYINKFQGRDKFFKVHDINKISPKVKKYIEMARDEYRSLL